MKRRQLLAIGGAGVLSLAGCVDNPPAASPTVTPPPTPKPATFGTAVALGDRSLTLSNPRIRKAVAADFGIWQEIKADDGQYVVVEATTAGPVASRFGDIDLASVVEGEPFADATLVVEGRPGDAPRDPSSWTARRLGFAFPDDPVDRAAIRWRVGDEAARWTLNDDLREQLQIEPAFELRQFDVSRAGDDVRVHLRVKNVGGRAGRFLARCSYEDIYDDSSLIELSVPRDDIAEFRGVPPILRGVAADHRVVTLAYSGTDEVGRAERPLEPR